MTGVFKWGGGILVRHPQIPPAWAWCLINCPASEWTLICTAQRCSRLELCPPPPDPVPPLTHSRASLLNLSPASSSSVPFPRLLKKERSLRLSVSHLLHLFRLLVMAGIEQHQAPSKTLAQSVVAECMLVEWLSYASCVTNDATTASSESVPQQITCVWTAELPHILCPSLTCSAY